LIDASSNIKVTQRL